MVRMVRMVRSLADRTFQLCFSPGFAIRYPDRDAEGQRGDREYAHRVPVLRGGLQLQRVGLGAARNDPDLVDLLAIDHFETNCQMPGCDWVKSAAKDAHALGRHGASKYRPLL